MKKVFSILMSYACVLGVSFADTLDASIDFEKKALWGLTPAFPLDDRGNTNRLYSSFWFFDGADGANKSLIREYTQDERMQMYDDFRFNSETNPKPPYMNLQDGNRAFLDVVTDSEDMLARTFAPVPSKAGLTTADCIDIPDTGLFVDMFVSFATSGAKANPQKVAASGDKLQVRLYASPDATSSESKPHLLVTAAGLDVEGNMTYANYAVTNQVEPNRWYRLTARVMANAATRTGETLPAFALYLDGTLVGCKPADYAAAIGAGGARAFAGNEYFDRQALFPSLQKQGGSTYAQKMYSVGVSGTAKLDEIGVTTDNPFVETAETVDAVIVCEDEMIASLTNRVVSADGSVTNEYVVSAAPFSGTKIAVRPGEELTVCAVPKPTYAVGDRLNLAGNVSSNTIASASGYTVKFAAGIEDEDLGTRVFVNAGRVTLGISSKRVYFRTSGGEFGTFAEAIAFTTTNAADRSIALQCDVVLSKDARTDNGQARVLPSQRGVLDLQGHKVKGLNFKDEAAIYTQGKLEIIDTVGGGMIEAPGEAIEVISTNDAVDVDHRIAALALGRPETADFTVRGRVRVTKGELTLYGGTYLTPGDTSAETFYLSDYVAPDRFKAVRETAQPEYWRVAYDGRKLVRFETPKGTVTPAQTNLELSAGALLREPRVDAVGYTADAWYVKGAEEPRQAWNFAADEVTTDMTLEAQLSVDNYTITYNEAPQGTPRTTYTVEDKRASLAWPTARRHFSFMGWRDANTGYFVSQIGAGATFVGTDILVHGNLQLESQWSADRLTWSNTSAGLVESNGVYSGTWPLRIPSIAGTYEAGDKIQIDEIAFALVNPSLYPKTAEYLGVTLDGGAQVVSAKRTYEVVDPESEYVVGTNRLANGRVKVAYKFDDLVITVGSANTVYFVGDTTPATSYLRLVKTTSQKYTIIGNCDPESAPETQPKGQYADYCPAYEISGHRVSEDGGEE